MLKILYERDETVASMNEKDYEGESGQTYIDGTVKTSPDWFGLKYIGCDIISEDKGGGCAPI